MNRKIARDIFALSGKAALTMVALCCMAQATLASPPGKPIIGVNVDIEGELKNARVYGTYYQAIEKSGGIPVLIPPMPEDDLKALLTRIDGVMLIGGDDYPPEFFGQKKNAADRLMHETRSSFDKLLTATVINTTSLPVLGICAGCQIINISRGGNLIQDIPSEVKDSNVPHRASTPGDIAKHVVRFVPGSHLSAFYKAKELPEPANHHQAVDKLGEGIAKAAQSDDGVTEAIEMKEKPFVIGVQFHPERDYENNKALFYAFIESARNHGLASESPARKQ